MSISPGAGASTRICPHCHAQLAASARFCSACGGAIPATPGCPRCGATVSETARFCPVCGATLPVDHLTSPAPTARPAAAPSVAGNPGDPQPHAAELRPLPPWLSTLLMMASPGQLMAQRLSHVSCPFALALSGTAFTLLFLQTGLDLVRAGRADMARAAALTITGAVYGTLGVVAIGLVAWALSRLLGSKHRWAWLIRALALGYATTLVYTSVGLLFNVFFKWNTSVAFGVTGVLWALGPMTVVFRNVMDGQVEGSIVLATVCGGLTLLGWVAIVA